MAERDFISTFGLGRDAFSIEDLVGPPVEADTAGALRPIRIPQTNPVGAGIEALSQTLGIGGKVAAMGKMREDRARQKFDMKTLQMEHEKDQMALDCMKTSFDVGPNGQRVLNKQKLTN